MAIKVGDRLPAGKFGIMTSSGPGSISTDELFKGKKVALFAVPGAFTPTCSKQHLPGFIQEAETLKKKGVDVVACLSVNDVFVMDAWGKHTGADGKVTMLADGNADYVKALGLELDASAFGLGTRAKRFSMLVEDGVVKKLNVEENPSACGVSGAQHLVGEI